MGLAASQARLLLLIARKSDLELNMQNVCQKRMNLSSEMSKLYNAQAGLNGDITGGGFACPDSFDNWEDFCDYIDTNDDGMLSTEEQLRAKQTYENAGVETMFINGEAYNMMYDGNKRKGYKYKGGSGNEIMWGSAGKDKFKGKGGYDIAFTMGGHDKVKQIDKKVGADFKYDKNLTSGKYTSEQPAEGATQQSNNASGLNYDVSGMDQDQIDALLSSLQEQDKQYEMMNERYETEHEAISTEYDSVEKVIENNIKKSFAAFK